MQATTSLTGMRRYLLDAVFTPPSLCKISTTKNILYTILPHLYTNVSATKATNAAKTLPRLAPSCRPVVAVLLLPLLFSVVP